MISIFVTRAAIGYFVGFLAMSHAAWFYFRHYRGSGRHVRIQHRGAPWWLSWVLIAAAAPIIFWLPGLAWSPSALLQWAGGIIAVAGLALNIWARHRLGRLWSPYVEVREDHAWVTNGPYAYLPHPIYVGESAVFFGAALLAGHVFGMALFVVTALLFYDKAHRETALLEAHLGPRPRSTASASQAAASSELINRAALSSVRHG